MHNKHHYKVYNKNHSYMLSEESKPSLNPTITTESLLRDSRSYARCEFWRYDTSMDGTYDDVKVISTWLCTYLWAHRLLMKQIKKVSLCLGKWQPIYQGWDCELIPSISPSGLIVHRYLALAMAWLKSCAQKSFIKICELYHLQWYKLSL